MRLIGLLGGVAGGKSMVARQLAELGAGILDADRAGHEVLRLPQVEAAARTRWGDRVFGGDGHIDRQELAKIVFAAAPDGPRERAWLEQLTHPEIGRRLEKEAAEMAAAGVPAAVLDAPLLLEAGWDRLCEVVVFVDAPPQARLARALARGWTESEFAARQAAQGSLDAKRRRATVTIDNSGCPEHTKAQIERFWHSLVS